MKLFPVLEGVNVMPNTLVKSAKYNDNKVVLLLKHGQTVSIFNITLKLYSNISFVNQIAS